MTVAQLKKKAAEERIPVKTSAKKVDIISAIEEHYRII